MGRPYGDRLLPCASPSAAASKHIEIVNLPLTLTEKDGLCPAAPNGTFGICVESCGNDQECPGDEKCCSNGCGHSCVAPIPIGKNLFGNIKIFNFDIQLNSRGPPPIITNWSCLWRF